MASLLKFITAFRGGEGYGWSEVHYKLTSSDNPALGTQLDNFELLVAAARQEMLGEDCAIVGLRVSYPRAGAVASLGRRQFLPGPAGHTGSAAALSLAINFIDTTFTKSKVVHLRGFWDSLEENESYHPELPANVGWEPRLVAWKNALITGGYGWPSKDPALSAKGTVTNYTVTADGIVTFTLGGAGMPAATVGTLQQIRFSKLNRSNSVLNRSILCAVTNANTVVSVAPHAAVAFESQGRFNFRGVSFVGYNQTGSISVGERRMGRPLNRYPGRAKARPTA